MCGWLGRRERKHDKNMKTVNLNVRISKELRDNFSKRCEEKCINKSDLTRKWIEGWLKEQG